MCTKHVYQAHWDNATALIRFAALMFTALLSKTLNFAGHVRSAHVRFTYVRSAHVHFTFVRSTYVRRGCPQLRRADTKVSADTMRCHYLIINLNKNI